MNIEPEKMIKFAGSEVSPSSLAGTCRAMKWVLKFISQNERDAYGRMCESFVDYLHRMNIVKKEDRWNVATQMRWNMAGIYEGVIAKVGKPETNVHTHHVRVTIECLQEDPLSRSKKEDYQTMCKVLRNVYAEMEPLIDQVTSFMKQGDELVQTKKDEIIKAFPELEHAYLCKLNLAPIYMGSEFYREVWEPFGQHYTNIHTLLEELKEV